MAAVEKPGRPALEAAREFHRAVNERIRDLGLTEFGEEDLVCECDDHACISKVRMHAEEYRALRSDALLFAVAPGHERAGSEELLIRTSHFVVVRAR